MQVLFLSHGKASKPSLHISLTKSAATIQQRCCNDTAIEQAFYAFAPTRFLGSAPNRLGPTVPSAKSIYNAQKKLTIGINRIRRYQPLLSMSCRRFTPMAKVNHRYAIQQGISKTSDTAKESNMAPNAKATIR